MSGSADEYFTYMFWPPDLIVFSIRLQESVVQNKTVSRAKLEQRPGSVWNQVSFSTDCATELASGGIRDPRGRREVERGQ